LRYPSIDEEIFAKLEEDNAIANWASKCHVNKSFQDENPK